MASTFTADDGETWEIVGYFAVNPQYVDVRRLRDGKMSVRPLGVVRAAGLALPRS